MPNTKALISSPTVFVPGGLSLRTAAVIVGRRPLFTATTTTTNDDVALQSHLLALPYRRGSRGRHWRFSLRHLSSFYAPHFFFFSATSNFQHPAILQKNHQQLFVLHHSPHFPFVACDGLSVPARRCLSLMRGYFILGTLCIQYPSHLYRWRE